MISDFMRVMIVVMMAVVASLFEGMLKYMWNLIRTTIVVVVNMGRIPKRQESGMHAHGL